MASHSRSQNQPESQEPYPGQLYREDAPGAMPMATYTCHVSYGQQARRLQRATLAVYRDRIEWTDQQTGLGALLGRAAATNTIMMRHVQGVTTAKAKIGWTHVRIAAGLDVLTVMLRKDQAADLRSLIVDLAR